MTIKLHWFLPTAGDSRTVIPFGEDGHSRPPTIDYLAQIAQAADRLGYEGVLTPTGTWCEDAWLVTAALLRETERLKFLVAFRPNSVTPTLAAQKAATYQRISNGRLLLNIVTGGEDTEQRRFGDWLDHDARYDRTDEFLTVLRGALSGAPLDFHGEHFRVEGATVNNAPEPQPELYFGGASAAAEVVAARHVDTYLAWGEPPDMVASRLERMRKLAADFDDERGGRPLRFGIRLHVISRDRADDAWAETERFLAQLDPAVVAQAQASLAKSAAVGQQRMLSLHQRGLNAGDPQSLVVAPNLWAGIGLVRGGAGTALVGSHDEVADRIEEYHELGFDEFIMSGHPHLEEAYSFAEGVFPILRRRGLLDVAPTGGNGYSRFAPTAAR